MAHLYRTDKIVTYLDSDWATSSNLTFRDYIAHYYRRSLPADTGTQPERAIAYISEGRWVADCPKCPSALLLDFGYPLYFCPDCGHGWFSIVFPSVSGRSRIEIALMKRPLVNEIPSTRNWLVGETIINLERENLARGIV